MGGQENEEKPFWTQFLRTDYDNEPKALLPMVMDVLDGNVKLDQIEDDMAVPINHKKEPIHPQTPQKARAMTAEEQEEEAKMKREMAKIRRLEQKIGMANKAQQDMMQKMYDHRMKMENMLNKAKNMEEEKKQATDTYDLKNRRGLTSQAHAQTAKKKPPVQSGKAIFKSKAQMAAEAEARMFGAGTPSKDEDGTFLTDLMGGAKKPDRHGSAKSALKPGR